MRFLERKCVCVRFVSTQDLRDGFSLRLLSHSLATTLTQRACLHRALVGLDPASSLPTPEQQQQRLLAAASSVSSFASAAANASSPPSPSVPLPAPLVLHANNAAMVFLTYESMLKTSVIADTFNKHPRIFIPLLGVLLAFLGVLVFDPLRIFNITNSITGRYSLHAWGDTAVVRRARTHARLHALQ